MFENVTALTSDEQLLRSMLGGDAEAFAALYDRRQGEIYRYALRMTGSPATAEDVTQEVFLSLIRDRSDYQESRGSVKSYLYGMARHRLLRRLEKERTLVSLDTTGDEASPAGSFQSTHDPFKELAHDEMIAMVRQAVLSLPAHFREVVVLCDLQEMNYADAAQVIECPLGTVRSRLARARDLLASKLGMLQSAGYEAKDPPKHTKITKLVSC
jgi:RNA polymerase sigma-70 factor, ECF subfamily